MDSPRKSFKPPAAAVEPRPIACGLRKKALSLSTVSSLIDAAEAAELAPGASFHALGGRTHGEPSGSTGYQQHGVLRRQLEFDDAVCDNVLRSVLSWLEPHTLLNHVAVVCKRFASASDCTEVWRRRASPELLQLCKSQAAASGRGGLRTLVTPGQHQHVRGDLKPAKLLTAVYCSNLLQNSSFLERMNLKGGIWHLPRHQARPTWEYPLLDDAATSARSSRPRKVSAMRRMMTADEAELPQVSAGSASAAASPSSTLWRELLEKQHAAAIVAPKPPQQLQQLTDAVAAVAAATDAAPHCPVRPLLSGHSPGRLMPFSTGCLACGSGGWSEAVQLVDLAASLEARGVPGCLASDVLGCGLPLGVSVWVAGMPNVPAEVQLVALALSQSQLDAVVGVPATGAPATAASHAPLVSLMLPPPGTRIAEPGSSGRRGADAAPAWTSPQVLRCGAERVLAALPPAPAPQGEWRQLRFRLPLDVAEAAAMRYVVLSLRGRPLPAPAAADGTPAPACGAFDGPKFALADLRFLGHDEADTWDNTRAWCT